MQYRTIMKVVCFLFFTIFFSVKVKSQSLFDTLSISEEYMVLNGSWGTTLKVANTRGKIDGVKIDELVGEALIFVEKGQRFNKSTKTNDNFAVFSFGNNLYEIPERSVNYYLIPFKFWKSAESYLRENDLFTYKKSGTYFSYTPVTIVDIEVGTIFAPIKVVYFDSENKPSSSLLYTKKSFRIKGVNSDSYDYFLHKYLIDVKTIEEVEASLAQKKAEKEKEVLAKIESEDICSSVIVRESNFENSITTYSPFQYSSYSEDLNDEVKRDCTLGLTKVEEDSQSSFYLSVEVSSSILEIDCSGVSILFDDGEIVNFPVDVEVESGEGSYWDYSGFISLDFATIEKLKKNKVSEVKVCYWEKKINKFESIQFNTISNCLIR